MSRKPAAFSQADVVRAIRAAEQAGVDWEIEIEGGVIRLKKRSNEHQAKPDENPLAPHADFAL